jgi:hypothetical protein
LKLQILDLAEEDLLVGFAFYERQSLGLGDYFLDSLYGDIASLRLHAGFHRVLFGFYRALSARFPFAIYYRITADAVSVWRVIDCRMDPAWIRMQLRDT